MEHFLKFLFAQEHGFPEDNCVSRLCSSLGSMLVQALHAQ